MKNIKKVLGLVLALMMVFSITCTSAFAADADEHPMPEGLVGETIEFTLDPGEDVGIMPLIWGQKYPAVGPNTATSTGEFTIPERYCAFEAVATVRDTGGTTSGYCSVELRESVIIHGIKSVPIDGQSHKLDWIDLEGSNSTCYFKVRNGTDVMINVLITYYSWA